MKKIGPLALLLIYFMLAGGYSIIFKIQQFHVQSEMLEELKEGRQPAIELTLTVSDFKKSKISSNEICFKGKMYDIESVSISGDEVKLLAINDTKEEKIIEKDNELSKNTNGQSKLPGQLLKLISMVYICPVSNYRFLVPEQNNHFLLSQETLAFYKPEITTPPPKVAC